MIFTSQQRKRNMFLTQFPTNNHDLARKDRHSISMRIRRHNRNLRIKKQKLKNPI